MGDTLGPLTLHQKINEADKQLVLVSYNQGIVGAGGLSEKPRKGIVNIEQYEEDLAEVETLYEDEPDAVETKTIKKQRVAEKPASSCQINGEKIAAGTRIDGQYCDPLTKQLLQQKEDGAASDNNFECQSNESRNGKCTNSYSLLKGLAGLIAKLTKLIGF